MMKWNVCCGFCRLDPLKISDAELKEKPGHKMDLHQHLSLTHITFWKDGFHLEILMHLRWWALYSGQVNTTHKHMQRLYRNIEMQSSKNIFLPLSLFSQPHIQRTYVCTCLNYKKQPTTKQHQKPQSVFMLSHALNESEMPASLLPRVLTAISPEMPW